MSDMKKLKPLDENAPERMKAFFAFDEGSGGNNRWVTEAIDGDCLRADQPRPMLH
jgi:hypothetical protein